MRVCIDGLYLEMLFRSEYGQAVRTLRSALNYESKKENGHFLRKDYNFNCYFALRKVCIVHSLAIVSDSIGGVCLHVLHVHVYMDV